MPLPKPNANETKKKFIDRCMSNATMKAEYEDEKQRLAVCNSLWTDSKSADEQPERRALAMKNAEVRIADDGDERKIVGYASVFYDGTPDTEYQLWDDYVERIMPGSFDRALAEKDDVRGLFNHDPDHLLGRTSSGTMTLSVDKRGLAYEIQPGETTMARDVVEHIKRGDVDGSSFAFRVTDEDIRKENDVYIREISGVQLFDVGPVTYPAYTATTSGYRTEEAVMAEMRAAVTGAVGAKKHPPGWKPASEEGAEAQELRAWAKGLDAGPAKT